MPLKGFARSAARRQPGYQSPAPLYELGGLNEEENPQMLRPGDLVRAFNCARKGRMTGTRPGVSYADSDYLSALADGEDVQGIHEFRRTQDNSRDLVVVANGKVFTDRTTELDITTPTVTITAGQNNLWTFTDFQDKMFAAGGADGDDVWYWDGTANDPGKIAFPAAFEAKFIFAKWGFIFVGGMNGTTFDDNAMVARYCDYATDATDVANWPSANAIPGQLLGENFGIGTYGSEFMTGFSEYRDNRGDFLLFLTNRRITSFVPNPNLTSSADAFRISDTVATGCVNQRAFVNLGVDVGDAVYLSQDGIHSLAQSQQYGNQVNEYLSWPIRKTFASLNRSRLKYATGAYWRNEGIVLFSVATGSTTTNDLILCLDIKNADRLTPENVRWYVWDLNGITPNFIVAARGGGSDDAPYIYVGGTEGEVVRFGRDVYADILTGGPNVDIQTRHEDFGVPSREKIVGDTFLSLQGQGGSTVQHTYMLDDGGTPGQSSFLEIPGGGGVWGTGKWGEMQWGSDLDTRRQRVPGVGSSVTIGHRFRHAGANQPFWIGMVNQAAFISGPADDAEANTIG